MGWLIALAIVVALAFIPLGIQARYDADGASAWLIFGPLRFALYPSRKKTKTTREKSAEAEEKKKKSSEKKKSGNLSEFFSLVDAVKDFLGELLFRKMRVNLLQARIVLAGDDPCDLAVNYGRAWAALGNLVPALERFFVIRKRDLRVECDFTANKTLIDAHIVLSITLGRLLHLGLRYGIRVLREFLKIVKLRKGGAIQ